MNYALKQTLGGIRHFRGCTILLIHGNKVTTEEAAQLLNKSPATIRVYASRGIKLQDGTRFHLRPTGLDHRGCNLYSLTDIRKIAKATQARGRSNAEKIPT